MDSLILESEWGKRSNMADNKKKPNDEFTFTNLPVEAQDPEIKKEDFVLTQIDKKVHDQKFQTKPTTFLKDSIKRFGKNKSSVVAAGILGGLLLLSIIVPLADTNDVSQSHPEIIYLEPKLFNAGTGFWDGTKKFYNIPVDTSADPEGIDKQKNWWPNEERFVPSAVTSKEFTNEQYTNEQTQFGKGGFIQTGYYYTIDDAKEYSELKTQPNQYNLDITKNHYVTVFDTYDSEKLGMIEKQDSLPENYTLGESQLVFSYVDTVDGKLEKLYVPLTPYSKTHNIGSAIESLKEDKINVSEKIKEVMEAKGSTQTVFKQPAFQVRVKNTFEHQNTCVLIKSIVFETEATGIFKEQYETPSFVDATQCIIQESKTKNENDEEVPNYRYWSSTGTKSIYMSRVVYCNFVYDSYEAKLGETYNTMFPSSNLDAYREKGWIEWNVDTTYNKVTGLWEVVKGTFECTILDPVKCPLTQEVKVEDCVVDQSDGSVWYVKAHYIQYKHYNYSSMPIFLFGTDKTGRDMFKYVFEGLRTSLLLGIITTVVCFLFGLLWGSISGYFGGTVDLVMERFTDILAGVPWIVVMTLVIIHMGSNFWTFAIALCLTGWIGTAATTRTQFYRFRGREYVLASRTLGASDARLIAKHILPNAMGTIITSAVLMIPSVIFSEATISYLGLGLKNLSSLGVILSNNQAELTTNPYLLIFPSVIIALLMISFNLAGNGLRDAVNPSLKGEE